MRRSTSARTEDLRRLSMMGFDMVAGSHVFLALVDLDIEGLRAELREARRRGAGGSLFAFMVKAIASCLAREPGLNAAIDWRKTTRFEGVDVSLPVEIEVDGKPATKQFILRDADSKPLSAIAREIEGSKARGDETTGFIASARMRRLFARLPRRLGVALMRAAARDHRRMRELSGTVFITSVSMFSGVPGYVVPYAGGPKAVSFAIGSARKAPVVRGDAVAVRETINLTVAFNHDIVDGAPAARFMDKLRKAVERDRAALID